MIAPIKDRDELQMNAYCDGELDLASAIEFERRLADDENLRARYNRLLSLRRAIHSLPKFDLPPGLEARIKSTLDADRPGRVVRLSASGNQEKKNSACEPSRDFHKKI